jgi:hypothetical protein
MAAKKPVDHAEPVQSGKKGKAREQHVDPDKPVESEERDTAADKPVTPEDPPFAAELRALVQKANAGDTGVLPRMRQLLDEHAEIWQRVGDLSGLVERAWIGVMAADNPLVIESLKRKIEEMRSDLAGDNPTGLERLMVDQVIGCWLEVKHVENESALAEEGSVATASFRLRRLESAQRRFDNAVKTLSSVRALLPDGVAPARAIKLYEDREKQMA